ncbi:MAG: hypothetical protein CBD32_07205 [Actinobacteria bacterium TMED172]|nr:hypothetical protein [Cellvibrionales bacterium]OUW32156.1 MAG: hypothetical protein CBD32_07205 [Actinobacteria bacterium TMED172]|tara:strand:- start:22021 stop:22743 length:723 start_codon:yes stop_codon:yes gene_type:complete
MRRLIYFALPIALFILPYFFFAFFDGAPFYFAKESGAVENITVVILALALLLTVRIFFQYRAKTELLKRASNTAIPFRDFTLGWLVVYALGCIYFFGEEISWGQHLFNWSTPDAWLAVNDQQETNLHNTSALLDQVPRFLLALGIVIGGLFYPFIVRNKQLSDNRLSSLLSLIMPSFHCVTAASTVLLITVHDKIYSLLKIDMPVFLQINDGEVKESLIAMFILVYIYDFYQRLKSNKYL